MHQAITDIAATWEISIPEEISEREILQLLAERISRLQAQQPEYFYQIMYRLDINEAKLAQALRSPDAVHEVAKLVWQRQWEKALSRRGNATGNEPDGDLKW